MKMHEEIEIEGYPLQDGDTPCGFGFVDNGESELRKRRISSRSIHLEYEGFLAVSKKEYEAGYPLIFSFPSGVEIDHTARTRKTSLHIWTAEWRDGFLECHSRIFGHPLPALLPKLEHLYQEHRDNHESSYRLNCLVHRPLGIDIPDYE